jgi:hypothetical protein
VLWSPSLNVTYENFMEKTLGLVFIDRLVEPRPLADWTDQWGPEEFYAAYTVANTSVCFEVHAPDAP